MELLRLKIDPVSKEPPKYKVTLHSGDKTLGEHEYTPTTGDAWLESACRLPGHCRLMDPYIKEKIKSHGKNIYDNFLGSGIAEKITQNSQTLVNLELGDDPILARIPWEIVHDGQKYLLNKNISFAHLTGEEVADKLPTIEKELRILIIGALPADTVQVAVGEEVERLKNMFLGLGVQHNLHIDTLVYNTTHERLDEIMGMAGGYHIIHYTGHGDTNALILEDDQGQSKPLDGAGFAEKLSALTPWLVFLNACNTGRIEEPGKDQPPDPEEIRFKGVAQALQAKAQVPIVIGTRYPVEDDFSSRFASMFYNHFLVNKNSAARAFLLTQQTFSGENTDWFTPMLFAGEAALEKPEFPSAQPKQFTPRITDVLHTEIIAPPHFIGRYPYLSQLSRDVVHGDKHVGLITGMGGLGKTSLAARAIDLWREEFSGTARIRIHPETKLDNLWSQLQHFFTLNGIGIAIPSQELDKYPQKQHSAIYASVLAQALKAGKFLILLDNFESILRIQDGNWAITDPALEQMLNLVIPNSGDQSRFIITSRRVPALFKKPELEIYMSYLPLTGFTFPETWHMLQASEHLSKSLEKEELGKRIKLCRDLHHWTAGLPKLLDSMDKAVKKDGFGTVKNYLERESDKAPKESDPYAEFMAYAMYDYHWESLSDKAKRLLVELSLLGEEIPIPILEMVWEKAQTTLNELQNAGLIEEREEKIMGKAIFIHPTLREFAEKKQGHLGIPEWEIQAILVSVGEAYQKAVEQMAELAKKLKEAGQATGGIPAEYILRVWEYLHLGWAHQKAADWAWDNWEALENAGLRRDAQRLLEKSADRVTDKKDKAGLWHNLGMLFQREGNFPKAQEWYEKSLEIEKKLGNKTGIASSLHQLAMLQEDQGNYPQAQGLYEDALKIFKKLENKAQMANVLHQLGILQQKQGNYPQAQGLYEDALKIFKKLENKAGMSAALHQLGMLQDDQGNYLQAQGLYEQSLEIARVLGNKARIAETLFQLGRLQQEQGNYHQAQRLYEESLEIAKELGNKAGIAQSLHQLGMLQQKQGNYSQAKGLYKQSLEIRKELGNKNGIAESMGQLGRMAEDNADPAAAAGFYGIALAIFTKLKAPYAKMAAKDLAKVKNQLSEDEFEAAVAAKMEEYKEYLE